MPEVGIEASRRCASTLPSAASRHAHEVSTGILFVYASLGRGGMPVSVTREDIIWAYRYLLRREPESEEVIQAGVDQGFASRADLITQTERTLEYRLVNNTLHRWFIIPVLGEQRLIWINLDDKHVSYGVLRGGWEEAETRFVRDNLRKGDAFLDIGANIGWFTMLASTIVGPSGSILAFEPRHDTSAYLRRTITLNRLGDMVRLHTVGLWHEPGEMTLVHDPLDSNPGGAFLDPAHRAGGPGANVPLITLDSLALDRCDLIKMDIEGAELMAMRGAHDTLKRLRPLILSELHANQLRRVSDCSVSDYIGFMKSLGYSTFLLGGESAGMEIGPDGPSGGAAVTSVVFVPRERSGVTIARKH